MSACDAGTRQSVNAPLRNRDHIVLKSERKLRLLNLDIGSTKKPKLNGKVVSMCTENRADQFNYVL
jgi:hypothetical protein